MSRGLCVIVSGLWLGLCGGRADAQSPREFLYTTNYGADSITGFRMDAVTGLLTPIPGSPWPATDHVEDLAIDPSNRFLYTTSTEGILAGYRIDPGSGALTPVPGSPYDVGGYDGLNVVVHPSGRFVYASDQVLGDVIGMSIDLGTGALSPIPGSPFQAGFMAAGLAIEPAGRFLYVAAGTFTNEIRAYAVDPVTGVLTPLPSTAPAGSNLSTLGFDPSGRHLYGTSYEDAVFGYSIDFATGAVTPMPGSPFAAGHWPQALAIESSGRFVYVPTSDTAAISVYARDDQTGSLAPLMDVSTVSWPDDVVVDPSNRFLYVTRRGASRVVGYAIDAATGGLTQVGPTHPTAFAPSGIAITNFQSQEAPSLRVTDVSVSEGAGISAFTVTLLPAAGQQVTVGYASVPGGAQENADYGPVSGTLSFDPGVTARTVTVPIAADTLDEDPETFSLRLSAGSAAIADGEGVATIADDDPTPALTVGGTSVVEGDTGMDFPVGLSVPSGRMVQVSYATADGTATAGSDYVRVSGTLTFAPGTTQQTVSTAAFADRVFEGDEAFSLALSAPLNAVVVGPPGQGTITDDDPPGLSIADGVVRERRSPDVAIAAVTISLSPASTGTVTVLWDTEDGTATSGSGDYEAASGIVTFEPGDTTKVVGVAVRPDAAVEGMETFAVVLSGAVGAPIAHNVGTTRVLDPPGGADFDGDGRTDLLWRHDVSGQNALWYMNGPSLIAGTFTTPAALADVRWKVVGTGDFNANGRPDVLWRHATSGEIVLWYMNGSVLDSGTFVSPSLADVRWGVSGTGDFNVDGQPDILWRHSASGEMVVWFMNGPVLQSGALLTPHAFADPGWEAVGTVDFNRDGRADVLWRHAASGENAVWFLDGTRLRGGAFLNPPVLSDVRWRIVALGDHNSDGQEDIVWRHSQAGQNAVWFMQGVGLVSGTLTDPAALPDVDWKIVGPR